MHTTTRMKLTLVIAILFGCNVMQAILHWRTRPSTVQPQETVPEAFRQAMEEDSLVVDGFGPVDWTQHGKDGKVVREVRWEASVRQRDGTKTWSIRCTPEEETKWMTREAAILMMQKQQQPPPIAPAQ